MSLTTFDRQNSSVERFLSAVKFTVLTRKPRLSAAEMERIHFELEYAESIAKDVDTVAALLHASSLYVGAYYTAPEQALLRIHEVAEIGTLSSCRTSMPLVAALFDLELVGLGGVASQDLTIGRGHIAPAFYAVRHCLGGLPLFATAAVHGPVPGVVHKEWGFANTMHHSLGEGLAMSVGRARCLGADRGTQICLVGDGELDEGISLESLRVAESHDVDRFVMLVDDNCSGIEPRPKPVNLRYLRSVFDRVTVLKDVTQSAVTKALACSMSTGLREAIVCKTVKGPHTFKSVSVASKQASTTSSQIRGVLEHLRKTSRVHFITADLPSRFGLKPVDDYVNIGLSEQASVGFAMALPDYELVIVGTDDKYLYNSMDIIVNAMESCQNVHIIAVRKNSTWGGHTTAPGIFAAAIERDIYELTDPADLTEMIQINVKAARSGFYLFNDQPMEIIEKMRSGFLTITPTARYRQQTEARHLVVTAESMSAKVHAMDCSASFSHLRLLTRKPQLVPELRAIFDQYERIIVVEYNSETGGLSQHLTCLLNRQIKHIGIKGYDVPRPSIRDDELLEQLQNTIHSQSGEIRCSI